MSPTGNNSWTYRATLDLIRTTLGPTGRIWRRDGRIIIGYETKKGPVHLGNGADYRDAFYRVFIQPVKWREELEQNHRAEMEKALADQQQDQQAPERGAEQPVEGPAPEPAPVDAPPVEETVGPL